MADIGIPALKVKLAEVIEPKTPPDYIWPVDHRDLLIDLIDTLIGQDPIKDTQTQDEAIGGTPTPSDEEAIHEFTVAYTELPTPNLVNKCDWGLHIKEYSIADNTVTVIIGVGSFGSADELVYDIIITKI
ncbi:MAG: hypothetical protein K8S00_12160 [Bacteroidales bacterium]|nr:hypothetical protein [Bacteroidales bacterium]